MIDIYPIESKGKKARSNAWSDEGMKTEQDKVLVDQRYADKFNLISQLIPFT